MLRRSSIQEVGGRAVAPWTALGYASLALLALLLGACSIFTDGATRIAYAIEAGVGALGSADGERLVLREVTPQLKDDCSGAYKAQFDQVGALILWCSDAQGQVVSSPSTTYHSRFVDTGDTWIVDKAAGSTLSLTLERRNGRAVIVDVR